MFSPSSIISSYSWPVCCSGLEDGTACCSGLEDDSGLDFWKRYFVMQWYTRTPTRTPITSAMAPVMTAVIPTATPTVKVSTVPVLEREATAHL